MRVLSEYFPEIAIVDLNIFKGHRVNQLRSTMTLSPLTRFVAVARRFRAGEIPAVVAAGVFGLISTDGPANQVEECLRHVSEGERWLPAETVNLAMQREAGRRELAARLTPRERQIAVLMADGLPVKRIAFELGISIGTVRQHLHRIFRKLQVPNRHQMISVITSIRDEIVT